MILGLAVIVGAFIVVGLSLFPAVALAMDQKLGVISAIKSSLAITRGNLLSMFAAHIVTNILGSILQLFTFQIATIVVMPFVVLLMAVLYLKMSGQPTAADPA